MSLNVDRFIMRPNEAQFVNVYPDGQLPQIPGDYAHNQVPSPTSYSNVRVKKFIYNFFNSRHNDISHLVCINQN